MSSKTSPVSKTLVAILASHDSNQKNHDLGRLLEELHAQDPDKLDNFRFLITGGTFDRVIEASGEAAINSSARTFFLPRCIRLPKMQDGGATLLANLIVERECSIVWPFLDPQGTHWLSPINLATLRLADLWRVKRLMNTGSVTEWFEQEAEIDARRNRRPWPPSWTLKGSKTKLNPRLHKNSHYSINVPNPGKHPSDLGKMTVALIAHNEMKPRMVEFAVDYERELGLFGKIFTTGTTGREVETAAESLSVKIKRFNSGPKGGDIQIATEILFGKCHVVIFFIDPLNPHPHIEDIRVVLGAGMTQDRVRMLTNEVQAREWMDRVVRGKT
jgi:methylglyoxal synthase